MSLRTSFLLRNQLVLVFLSLIFTGCNKSHVSEQQLLDSFSQEKSFLNELLSKLQSSKIELGVASDFGYQNLPKTYQQQGIQKVSTHKFSDVRGNVYLFAKSQESKLTFTETFKGYAYLPKESEFAQFVPNLDQFIEQSRGSDLVFRKMDGEASWYLYYESVTLE
jgi:hypothetical protein